MRTVALLLALSGTQLPAQETLEEAARRVRDGWLAHDAETVVGQATRVVLQIRGADPSAAVSRQQAVTLLARYLRQTSERALEIGTIREVKEGRGLVELDRRYTVEGTADERRETVFLGFRRQGDRWELVELRSAP